MKTLTMTILLIMTFVSCEQGGGSSSSKSCSTANELVQNKWRDTFNNDIYALSSCGPNQDCAYCLGSCGDSVNDFRINYNNGAVTIHYYFYGTTRIGTYKVCTNTMTINWDNGDQDVFEKVVE